MANTDYKISAGSKLSFGTLTSSGDYPSTWTDLTSCTEIPQIGGTPDKVDSTTLDNMKFKSGVIGLQEIDVLDFPFNMEHPEAGANINVVDGLDADTQYGWKITYSTGVVVKFKSKASYSLNAVGVNAISSFTLHLSPEGEPEIDVPTTSI